MNLRPVLSESGTASANGTTIDNITRKINNFYHAAVESTLFLNSLSFAILGCDGSAKITSYQ